MRSNAEQISILVYHKARRGGAIGTIVTIRAKVVEHALSPAAVNVGREFEDPAAVLGSGPVSNTVKITRAVGNKWARARISNIRGACKVVQDLG